MSKQVFINGEHEIMSDEEIKDFSNALNYLESQSKSESVCVLNKRRAEEFREILLTVNDIFHDTCSVKWKIWNDVGGSVWCISVRGSSISLKRPKFFSEHVLRKAKTFEVVTDLDKNVEMNITFDKMTDEVC